MYASTGARPCFTLYAEELPVPAATTASTRGTISMERRRLGQSDVWVTVIAFGAWAIGSQWGPQDDEESVRALHTALDAGIGFIDTAQAYGDGRSERLIARVFRERKERVPVATKIPPKTGRWAPPPGTPIEEVFPPQYIVERCERSLRDLETDAIDLLQFHTWLDEWNATDDWYETMDRLRSAGKIRAIGISVSDNRPDEANGSVAMGRVDTVQVVYNILDQRAAVHLFPLARQHGTSILARVPLASGALTGKFRADTAFPPGDWRRDFWTPDVLAAVVQRVERIRSIVGDDVPLAARALQFAYHDPVVASALAGTRSVEQARENAQAAAYPPLTEEVLARLRREAMDVPPPASPG